MAWDRRIRAEAPPKGVSAYRLGADSFFFKLYANPRARPPLQGLLRGMYLPLSYWTSMLGAPATLGPRGGRLVTYENIHRYLNTSQFVDLVGDGWLGSPVASERVIKEVIAHALEQRHSVTLASASRA